MNHKFTNRLLVLVLILTCFRGLHSQAQQLELFNTGNALGNGPITTGPVTATFRSNTGTSSTTTTYTPATTVSISFSNQQYTSASANGGTYPGITSGSIGMPNNVATLDSDPVFIAMSTIGNPLNSYFSSAPTPNSGNISTTNNYGFHVYMDAYYQQGNQLTARNYYGDLTVSFSRPVINPVLHLSGIGGVYTNSINSQVQGFYSEFELSTADVSAGYSLSRLSGSTYFVLDASNTKVLNNNTANYTSATAVNYTTSQVGGSAGSIRVNSNGTAISSVTFRLYLRGSGGSSSTALWGHPSSSIGRAGDGFLLSASLALNNISGTVFNDIDGVSNAVIDGNVVNGTDIRQNTGTTVPIYANLVQGGVVVASTPVSNTGTYSFTNTAAGVYDVIISTSATSTTPVLPLGWSSTGEWNGTSIPNHDGTPNSTVSVTATGTNITNVNFGIAPTPVACNAGVVYATAASNQQTLVTINPANEATTNIETNLFGGGAAAAAVAAGDHNATSAIALDIHTNTLWFCNRGVAGRPARIFSYNISTRTHGGTSALFAGNIAAVPINKAAYNPVDKHVYFHYDDGTNNRLYKFNPATPSVAATLVGAIAVSGYSSFSGGDLAFDALGNLTGAFTTNILAVFPAIYNATTGVYEGFNLTGQYFGTTAITSLGSVAFLANGDYIVGGAESQIVNISTAIATNIPGTNFPSNDFASCAAPSPLISVNKSATLNCANNNLVYTITVANTGTFHAVNTLLIDALPAGVTLNSATLNGAVFPTTNLGTTGVLIRSTGATTDGQILRGETATIVLNCTLQAGLTGAISNQAFVKYTGVEVLGLPNHRIPSNDPSTVAAGDATVTNGCAADLQITKEINNLTPQVGNQVIFTIVATNNGPVAATGVTVTENIPTGYSVVSVTPSAGTWTAPTWSINNLAINASATLTVVATINATGVYANTVTIAGNQTDPTPGNNTDTETPTVNRPPISVNDTYIMPEDGGPITLLPLTGDTDPDGHTLTITSINGTKLTPGTPQTITVTNGTVNVAANGTITFTPAPNFNGNVSFPYTISDGNGGTSTANEIITVTPVNDPPVAVDDNYTVPEDGGPITLLPLTGDTDPDGNTLTITSINGTTLTPGTAQTITVLNGTVNIAADGTITFTPAPNFNGNVSFPYTISDGNGGTSTANEIITITPVNDPPVAVDDNYITPRNTTVTLLPQPNDSDIDGNTLTIVSINGTTLTPGTAQTITVPNGTVYVAANGTITFEPAPNYMGTVTFPYVITDGTTTATANQIILITAPVPVKLLHFTANKTNNNEASLTWATSLEQNNKGFAIEHSADGITWSAIAFVNSKATNGNSSSRINYSFLHTQPVNGINYYRLKQTDLDGKSEYSDVRTLNFEIVAAIKVYPNPAVEWVMLEGINSNHTIIILDAAGKLMKIARSTSNNYRINISSFAVGTYHVIIRNAGGKIIAQHRIVKSAN
ncbi:MAG: tandem-95 repeat protein [Sphingobacteriales bacterium]|nr:MAG: tandem-95 repeat protein [Sphingobacteriales bacterium]